MERHGRPNEELFLKPSETVSPDSPTIGPLRIHKRESRESVPKSPPLESASRPGPQFSRPPPMPSYPAPPTNAPTAPLPYPADDGPPTGYTPLSQRERADKNVTPLEAGRRRRSSTASSSPRPRYDAHDPNRPTLSGYGPHTVRANDGYEMPAQASHSPQPPRTTPKPLPDSPGPETPDKKGLYERRPQRRGTSSSNPYPEYHQQYWPPPKQAPAEPSDSALGVPSSSGVNRLASTASVSTTRAQRGSPPPPETPIVPPPAPGGIEARFAATGIAGPSTLSNLQAESARGAQRNQGFATAQPIQNAPPPSQAQQAPGRPWTPTEQPGSLPYGPPTVYQGPSQIGTQSPPHPASSPPRSQPSQEYPLQQDMARLHVGEEPPPAYSSLQQASGAGGATAQGFPNEKRTGTISQPAPQIGVMSDANLQAHPAFANDPRQQQPGPSPQGGAGASATSTPQPQQINVSPAPAPAAGPASPPPLPEGWIAHLDQNSGQYYYIHLPTQSTQWEFPKGPTPLNLNEPMSPTGSFAPSITSPGFPMAGKTPLASPGFAPQTASFSGDMMSMGMATPTAAGFTGPPPAAGVDMYKVAPTNSVYFGPYLRYTNMDIERGLWLGSILLITNTPHPPTIHIHQSVDLSPNPRQLKANPIYTHQTWIFYRYDVNLKMEDENAAKWTYAITSHLGCTRFEFLVAGRNEMSWRFTAHSGNDFALNVNAQERSKLGGVGFMWKDILQKNAECGGFHVQLGLGGQINADRLWKELPLLKQWTAMSGKDNRRNAPWTVKHEEEVCHAYFHYYTSHFDQAHLREAFAQIPHVLSLDDHDMYVSCLC